MGYYDDRDVIILGLVGTVALIVGCAALASYDSGYDYAKVCGNDSYVRIEDDACTRGDAGSSVMFISTSSNYQVPPVGGGMDRQHFVRSLPPGKTAQPNFTFPKTTSMSPKANPNIQRGGFGFSGGKSSSS